MQAIDAPVAPLDAPRPDKATALRFLRALFSCEAGARGYLQFFSLPGAKARFFDASRASNLHFAAAHAASEARHENSYFGVGLQGQKPSEGRRGNEGTVIAIPGVWVDLDVRGPAHKATNLPPTVDDAGAIIDALGLKPSIIVHSGHGLQVYWLFHKLWHLGDQAERTAAKELVSRFQAALRQIAQTKSWTIDNTADLARVLRIPGTLNRKIPSDIKLVSFEDFETRYSVSDIKKVVEDAPKSQPLSKPKAANNTPDFPPAKLPLIVEGCAWMRHCRDDAADLPEPEWFAALSVVSRCEDGEAAAHEWSRPYPNYSPSETQRKVAHTLNDAGPTTCEYVSNSLGQSGFCTQCPHLGKIKSPINLGTPANSGGLIQVEESWPTPEPLLAPLPSVHAFDPELLPSALRDWVMDVAERLQAPADFPAATVIVALAGATGRRALITPKRFDNWEVVPNLWGGIVGRPGTMKSPCIQAVLRPLKTLEEAAVQEHEEAMVEYERQLGAHDVRKAAWKVRSAQAAKKEQDFDVFDDDPPERPALTRFIVNDATLEKLHAILEENPQGVFYTRDELAGWFATLDSPSRERERPFFLEAWNGDSSYTIDRIGRGTLHVRNLCLSVFGGIQPARLQDYLTGAVTGGTSDDGLAQRLQVLVWPDLSPEWRNVDRPPNEAAGRSVEEVFSRVVAISPAEPLRARFCEEAQELFDEWREELETRLRTETMAPVLEAHLAKYRKLMPALALILHLADAGPLPQIPLVQAQRAADWCFYLESHARRVYSGVVSLPIRIAATLAEKLKRGALGTEFTVRDVYRPEWVGLDTRDLALKALDVLEDAGWVRPIRPGPRTKGGRRSERYALNPKVRHG